MKSKKFIFGAQPALDKAVTKQGECEEAVVAARKVLAAEEKELQDLTRELEVIRQRRRELHDNLVSPARTRAASDPRELMRVSQSLDVQKLKEERQLERIAAQRERVKWAADK